MFTSAIGRNIGNGSFQNLQQCLLYAFTRNISCNGWVFTSAGNFINFIYINDSMLCLFNVVVCRLNQLEQNIFNIFAHIACFR